MNQEEESQRLDRRSTKNDVLKSLYDTEVVGRL